MTGNTFNLNHGPGNPLHLLVSGLTRRVSYQQGTTVLVDPLRLYDFAFFDPTHDSGDVHVPGTTSRGMSVSCDVAYLSTTRRCTLNWYTAT